MSHTITLLPSGHRFEAEPQETVLDAALRAGINLNYSCNSGTCGDCRAKLLSGVVGESLFYDYRFPAAEAEQGMQLLCRIEPGSDMSFEVHEVSDTAEIPLQHLSAKVKKIERLGHGFIQLQLQTLRTQTLRFLAGQHVKLRFAEGLEGDFSVASCPCNGRDLQFHLYRNADDKLARYVDESLRVRESVEVLGPFGDFTYNEASSRRAVFICLDTGFAAIKSLIEHAIALDVSQPLTLFWISHKRDGHYLENYCRSWASVMDNFSYRLLAVETEDGSWRDYTGVTRELAAYLPREGSYEIYTAVSDALLPALERALAERGVRTDALHLAHIRGQSVF